MASRFISTSIPYVNAAPHIGFALEAVHADVLARYWRLQGDDVCFLSGTDENALKNVLKAEEAGEDTAAFVERHAALFASVLEQLNISNDDFIRTATDPRHRAGAQKLWESLKKEDITTHAYEGRYCVGCEEFKQERDLVDGRCPEHPAAELEVISEENYFFKLGNYQDTLEQLIASGELRIIPETRKREVLSFIRSGLHDLSISRSVERARGWGVPVPGDDAQVMYVWVDALSNYINALGYADDSPNFTTYWKDGEPLHVIGKGISRFHAIYWPAFLLSAGIPLPKTILVHGYVTGEGGTKMSKSLGNTIDPSAYIAEYGTDALRYFIARELSQFEDGEFTRERFKEAYTANLVNGLGNLVARIMQLAQKHLAAPVARPEESAFTPEYVQALERLDINTAADYVWQRIGALDRRITETEPFKVIKDDAARGRALINDAAVELYQIGRMLQPFMPETSDIIKRSVLANTKPENLFPRIDV